MRYIGYLFVLAFVLICALSDAAENITVTTYFPSPYGAYNDLNVHRDLTVKDSGGTTSQVTLNTNSTGDLVVRGSGFFQIVFNDTTAQKPFSYLQGYDLTNLSGATWCASGYVAANYLNTNKIPVDMGNPLPNSGYIVCVRAWE